jgi:hypothetical protein
MPTLIPANQVGVQLHLRWEGTPYYDLPRVIAALRDLGAGHVRDSFNVGWPAQNAQIREVADACGVKFTLTARASDPIEAFVRGVAALGDRVIAVEGVNEWDNTGRPDWAAELRTHQATLYAAVKQAMPNMPVLAPALADARKAPSLGSVPCDLGNAHAYPNGVPQSWLEVPVKAAASVSAGRSVVVTETGYTNALDDRDVVHHHPVTEAIVGGYMAELVTAHLAAGAPRVYVYELFDQAPGDTDVEHGFGLIRNDGTPKPAYTALKQLIGVPMAPTKADRWSASLRFDSPGCCPSRAGKQCVFLEGTKAGQERTGLGPHTARLKLGDRLLELQAPLDAAISRLETALAQDRASHEVTLQQLVDVQRELDDLRAQAIVGRADAARRIQALEAEIMRLTKPPVPVVTVLFERAAESVVKFPANKFGGGAGRNTGHVLPKRVDEATLEYEFRFEPGFEWRKGFKLPGLEGVAPGISPTFPTGGKPDPNDDGWSFRWMGLEDKGGRFTDLFTGVRRIALAPAELIGYFYHPKRVDAFGDVIWTGQPLAVGPWFKLRTTHKVNTVGKADGILRASVNDMPVIDRANVLYRTRPEVPITHLLEACFPGGADKNYAAPIDRFLTFRNVRVTTPAAS